MILFAGLSLGRNWHEWGGDIDMNGTAIAGGLVLIGMPGAGKSTLGKSLAAHFGRPLVDTDLLIEQAAGEPLQAVLDRLGYLGMRDFEEQCVAQAGLPEQAALAGC